jgi:trans-2,3-dihydro-3-hydroxyanthranilate isomerase
VSTYRFETVDVFTDRRFGGNPLAVFPDARGLSSTEMQRLAFELNLSETTFVLPPASSAHSARVRIFNRTTEMPFAGHPSIGTAYVLAKQSFPVDRVLRLEVPAGIVVVDLATDETGEVVGGRITAPQPLTLAAEIPVETIAACACLLPTDVVVGTHAPVVASVGNPFVIAEVTGDALSRCAPDIRAFKQAVDARPAMAGRFSLHLYARDADKIRARMFAPLAGTYEDPATGSANAPLAGLLLSRLGADRARFTVRQGVEMGRPSLLEITAYRAEDGIRATVAGHCIPVFKGEIQGMGEG